MKRVYYLVFLIILLPVIALVLYSGIKSKDVFSENLIISLSNRLDKDIAAYFQPIRTEFTYVSDYFGGSLDQSFSEDSVSSVLIPTIILNSI